MAKDDNRPVGTFPGSISPVADFSGTVAIANGDTVGSDTLTINGVIGSISLVIPDMGGKTLTLRLVDADGVVRRQYPDSISDNTSTSDPARVLVDYWECREGDNLEIEASVAVGADRDIDYYGRLT